MMKAASNADDEFGVEQDMTTLTMMAADPEAPPPTDDVVATGGNDHAAQQEQDHEPSSPTSDDVKKRHRRVSHMSPAEVPVWSSDAPKANHNQNNTVTDNFSSSAINATVGDHNKPSSVSHTDLDRMKDSVYFLFPDRNERLSRFWILLILAAIIATSGVVSDSTATVIGAMIVAPLMTPILGVMLSAVLTDGRNFACSLILVVTGMGSCILVGYLYGFLVTDQRITPENNSQVSGRVSPSVPDLVGALATGMVGAIALVRTDIAGALPGVAISISLVPPLTVVGLMLSSKDVSDAAGAMLLFATNFMSIQVMGIFTMYLYGVHKLATRPSAKFCRTLFLVMVACLALVAVPLYYSSAQISAELKAESCLTAAINDWIEPLGWNVTVVVATTYQSSNNNDLQAEVVISGPPPLPNTDDLDSEYIQQYCPEVEIVSLSFLPTETIDVYPAN